MSINIGNDKSVLTIYKDEQGRYNIYIKGTEIQENGETKDIFMRKKVQFKNGVEVKNRSKIEVIKGWTSCYRIKTNELNDKGEPKYKYLDKYFISVNVNMKMYKILNLKMYNFVQNNFNFYYHHLVKICLLIYMNYH